jgi:hypothetical protein
VIFLTSSSDRIYAATQGSATYDVQGAYIDWDGSRFTLGRVNLTIPGAANTDVIVAPSAGVQRHVQRMTIRNTHASIRGNLTFRHTDGTTDVPLWGANFNAGNTVQYSDSRGWEQFSAPYGGVVQVNYNVWSYAPSTPGGITDGTNWRALGANAQFTPTYSTRVYVTATGRFDNVAANIEHNAMLAYGLGTPPAFNTILPGGAVVISSNIFYLGDANAGGMALPLSLIGLITGLTLGTTYWVDLFMITGGGTEYVQNVYFIVMEI